MHEMGFISIEANSNKVFGFGTRWLTYIKPGDVLILDDEYEIDAVNDFNQLTLKQKYKGASLDKSAYKIRKENTLERLKSEKIKIIIKEYQQAVDYLYSGYDKIEISTFDKQLSQAKEFIATGQASIFLKTLAKNRGETEQALSEKIIDNANNNDFNLAEILARKQSLINKIKTVKSLAELQQIKRGE